MLASSYQDSENLQKIIVVMKNPTKGKIIAKQSMARKILVPFIRHKQLSIS